MTRAFRAHQLAFVWSARFLPELNPIAAGLSGVARVGLARFLLYASGSALAWAGAWVGVGFLLAGTIAESPGWLGISASGLGGRRGDGGDGERGRPRRLAPSTPARRRDGGRDGTPDAA